LAAAVDILAAVEVIGDRARFQPWNTLGSFSGCNTMSVFYIIGVIVVVVVVAGFLGVHL
jgi:hypothetical protein